MGGPYNPATGLVDSGFGEGDDRCYIDAHPATLELGVKPTKITHCYYQGRHYSSMVDFEFSKLNQVVRAVSKQVGKPELELKEYVSWSEIEEKIFFPLAFWVVKEQCRDVTGHLRTCG